MNKNLQKIDELATSLSKMINPRLKELPALGVITAISMPLFSLVDQFIKENDFKKDHPLGELRDHLGGFIQKGIELFGDTPPKDKTVN